MVAGGWRWLMVDGWLLVVVGACQWLVAVASGGWWRGGCCCCFQDQ